jgi:regulatory protein SWI6
MQVARPSLSSSFPQGTPPAQPAATMYHNSPHAGPGLMAAPGFNRSFPQADANGYQQHAMDKPQIYTVRAMSTPGHGIIC